MLMQAGRAYRDVADEKLEEFSIPYASRYQQTIREVDQRAEGVMCCDLQQWARSGIGTTSDAFISPRHDLERNEKTDRLE